VKCLRSGERWSDGTVQKSGERWVRRGSEKGWKWRDHVLNTGGLVALVFVD